MRLKTLGVIFVTATALFTMFYWLTDESRRDARGIEHHGSLIHYGEEIYGPMEPPLDFAADCAACHGEDGRGGGPDALVVGPSLRSESLARKVSIYAGTFDLNYIDTVIRKGGVAVSGNIESPMPAWENTLNEYQIDALVALIESWLEEPDVPTDTPDTVEAGQEVYMAQCAACHGPDRDGPGQFPDIRNVDEQVGDDLLTDIADLDQYLADHAEDPRLALERWIRDSWENYNAGQPTQMPRFDEVALPDDQLTALITFLLEVDD
jgi:mono/diheme cytochrome c family protein